MSKLSFSLFMRLFLPSIKPFVLRAYSRDNVRMTTDPYGMKLPILFSSPHSSAIDVVVALIGENVIFVVVVRICMCGEK